MEKRILAYRRYMDEMIAQLMAHPYTPAGEEEKIQNELIKLKREHLVQIGFFQHERLIHLIVTVLFAVLEFLSLMIVVLLQEPVSALLPLVVLILLVPYIRHYYILENEVQKMYAQYDELEHLMESKKSAVTCERV